MQADTNTEWFLVMGSKDTKQEWFGCRKCISHFWNLLLYEIIEYTLFLGNIGCPVGVTINIILNGGVSTLYMSLQVDLNIKNNTTFKEYKRKVEGGAKTKSRCFQQ